MWCSLLFSFYWLLRCITYSCLCPSSLKNGYFGRWHAQKMVLILSMPMCMYVYNYCPSWNWNFPEGMVLVIHQLKVDYTRSNKTYWMCTWLPPLIDVRLHLDCERSFINEQDTAKIVHCLSTYTATLLFTKVMVYLWIS